MEKRTCAKRFCVPRLHALMLLPNDNKFPFLFCKHDAPLLSLSSASGIRTEYIQYLWGLIFH